MSAAVIHTRAPAKGLAVAPEACWEEGAELPHCLVRSREACETRRRGTTRCSARTLPVCSASTQRTHNATGGPRPLAFDVLTQTSHGRACQTQIPTAVNMHSKSKKIEGTSVCMCV